MTDQPSLAEVDGAVAAFLHSEDVSAVRQLVAAGPYTLARTVEIYGLPPRDPRFPQVVRDAYRNRHDRELVDAWATLLAALAQAFPEAYLDEIDARRLNASQEIATISQLDHPRAAALLRRHSTNRDWLVRYHAVAGLGRHTDPESARALEGALVDVEQMIRDEAARWVQRRDPRRAWLVYEQLLQHKHLAPELRQELERRLITAKRLAARRKR
jgi:hypothetical protein